jgi:hypothetical protein
MSENATAFDFSIGVNESDIKRGGGGFTLMPNGKYTAAFQGATLIDADSGQRIETEFAEFETPEGATTITAKDGTVIDLTGRHSKRYTLWPADKAKLIKFAQAFGLAVKNGDVWTLAVTTPAEFVEALNAKQGERKMVGIRQQNRKRGGSVVTKDDGSPVVDDNIYWVDAI